MLITLYRIFSLLIRLSLPGGKKNLDLSGRLQKLGPIFIKFGQTFSSRPDIFGEEVSKSLLTLCDKLPSFPFKQVRKTIEEEFGKKLEEVFPYFEEKAISAASIAQVHKAHTMDGRVVAVKVLRPKIEQRFKKDLRLLKVCITILYPLIPQRFRIYEVLELFSENIKFELDMSFEAANATELRSKMSEINDLYIPEIEWSYTSRRILTLEWIEGKSIAQFDYSPQLAQKLAASFIQQAYYHGFFHGDMHSGNILITDDNQIALVDFGIVGHLDQKTKVYVAEILLGFIKRDYKYVADIHFRAGYVSSQYNRFVLACRAIGEPMIQGKISAAQLLSQLFKITADFNMEVQPQLLLLQKTILLVEGHCLRLYPEADLWELVKPHMEAWAKDNLGCKAKLTKTYFIQKINSLAEKYEELLDSLKNTPKSNDAFLRVLLLLLIVYIILGKIL